MWALRHGCKLAVMLAVWAALATASACTRRRPSTQSPDTPGASDRNGAASRAMGDAGPASATDTALDAGVGHASSSPDAPAAARTRFDAGRSVPAAGDAGADAATRGDAGAQSDNVLGGPIDAPTPVGCVSDVTPGVHDFMCDSTIDTVSVPEACTKRACGVIVDVHGGMMSSQMEDKNTDLRALGAQHGYIVIQPNALQNALLLDQRLFVADTDTQPADDTRVMDILMQVVQAFHVNEKRIHMTGFSEGGYMTWRWFCAHSDLLASVAAGPAGWQCANLANLGLTPPEVGCEMSGSNVPAHDIPMLYMQGMMDGLVDPQCADGWVRSNVLRALALGPGTVIAGDPVFQTAHYVRTRYENPDGVPFEYIQHQYSTDASFLGVGLVGHCYPGSTDLTVTPPEQTVIPPDQLMSFGCKDQCEFNWGEEVIAFFMAHPRP